MSAELRMLFQFMNLVVDNPPAFWEDFIDTQKLLAQFEAAFKLHTGEPE